MPPDGPCYRCGRGRGADARPTRPGGRATLPASPRRGDGRGVEPQPGTDARAI